ncbi:hypothetical protein GCK72_015908 [Caenorhabditis remanei]|uniref:Uncharacterized protein n=1 Tax=Caenorhabditis remanei TaxID=31234 RepID=A0A6A5GXP1_CAERE|nr:hypothetical protein GCK72_015908 [Caenorhabditis remanei]KAF1759441.1 hypothetical protein GCK72_015908 [Caenorhabditis remanei]
MCHALNCQVSYYRSELTNCRAEKEQLEAQLANGKSEIQQLEATLNDANAAIGSNEKLRALDQEAMAKEKMELKESYDRETQKNRKLQEQQDLVIQELESKLAVASQKERKLQEQHVKEMRGKDSLIQELESKLTASQEENARKIQDKDLDLQKEITLKEENARKIQELEKVHQKNARDTVVKTILLENVHQISSNKILKLQEQHDKDIGAKDLKIQMLELELSTVQKNSCEKILKLQEQHDKRLCGKDLEIQQLEIKLAAAKKEISEKELQEHTLLEIQAFDAQNQCEKVSVKNTEQMPNHVEKPKSDLQEKKSEEPTLLHIDLGKLYMELQEAKKPQEALTAQLAAKDKEIVYLTKQQKSKLAAKDSKILILTEKNENLQEIIYKHQMTMMAKDRQLEALKEKVADLEAELAELKDGRDGQSE